MMELSGAFHVVILAAQRRGKPNDLAESEGVSHKCLIEIEGRPLIAHVLEAVLASGLARRITVSIETEAPLEGVAEVQRLKDEGVLRVIASADNLADSVGAALEGADTTPALVTTADNALLTGEMLTWFAERAMAYDAAAAMIEKETMRARYPDGQRNFHRFKDGEFSNCNLYAAITPQAAAAADVFRSGGQFLKAKPMVIARRIGVPNMIAYRFALLKRDTLAARIGKRFGVRLGVVDMPFPEAPIDVDNARSLKLSREILAKRAA